MNHHDILGLPRDASPCQVKQRYRELALRMHPDRNKSDTTEQFKRITCSYRALSGSTGAAESLDDTKRVRAGRQRIRRKQAGGDVPEDPDGQSEPQASGSWDDLFNHDWEKW